MIKSYQQDYLGKNTPDELVKKISSLNCSDIIRQNRYASGEVPFMDSIQKLVFSNKEKQYIANKYAPNFKIDYGFGKQLISQSVGVLTTEPPLIQPINKKDNNIISKNLIRKLGYALNEASFIAKTNGYAFIFESYDEKFTVFENDKSIAYLDDLTGEVKAFVRFWQADGDKSSVCYFEHYTEKGIETYKIADNKPFKIGEIVPYIQKVNKDILKTNILKVETALPIFLLKNNKNLGSSLSKDIISKINIISLIESGWVNVIEEFSEVYLEAEANGLIDQDRLQEWLATVKETRSAVLGNAKASFKTLDIPSEARDRLIEKLKKELIQDSGIFDTTDIGSNIPQVVIDAKIWALKQNVTNFEYEIDAVTRNLIVLWQKYNNKDFDFEISFIKLYPKNITEIINNAVMLKATNISPDAWLKYLQEAISLDLIAEISRQEESCQYTLTTPEFFKEEPEVPYGQSSQLNK